ncbi:MAG: hypothetical protein R2836_04510 [Chitinophagales bacterium]
MGNNLSNDGCSFSKIHVLMGEKPDEPDMVENYMDYLLKPAKICLPNNKLT